jgi:hypothetical protein
MGYSPLPSVGPSPSPSPSPSPTPVSPPAPVSPPTPAPPGDGISPGPQDAATAALSEALDQPLETEAREGVLPLDLSLGADAPDTSQGGWASGFQEPADPYGGLNSPTGLLASFVGQDVDLFTGVTAESDNPNFYTGGQNVESFSGVQNAESFTGGGGAPTASPMLAFDIGTIEVNGFERALATFQLWRRHWSAMFRVSRPFRSA